jgi:large subunit ribosomal protein L23
MSILIKPIITEKATDASERFNRYTFVVNKNANKIQIKDAVEAAYGVTVDKVRTLNHPALRKTKYTKKGLVSGLTSGYKKAVVQLAEGEIDFYNNL